MIRRRYSVLLGIAAPLALATAAYSFWSGSAVGIAHAGTGSMNPPTGVTASTTPGAGIAHVSWTASAPYAGRPVSGYYVTRVRTSDSATAAACGTSPASLTTGVTCDDLSVADGSYHYLVTAAYYSWTAAGAPSNPVTVVNDSTPPGVTINQAAGQADPANTATVSFAVAFTEPVTGFDGTDVTLSGTAGATTAVLTGSGASYTVAVSGMTGPGTVIASIDAGKAADLAGNLSLASASTDNTVTYDAVPPSVTVSRKAGQATTTPNLPVLYTVTFSEPVTGFDGTDLTRTGTSTGGTVAVTGSGAGYEISVSGTPTGGTIGFGVAAGRASDLAGNLNLASPATDNTVTYTYSGPANSLSLANPNGAYLSGSSLYFAADAAGDFNLVNSVTDPQSAPKSTHYPALAATGWSHADETVQTPAGGPFTSKRFGWNPAAAVPGDYTITGANSTGSSTPAVVHFVSDTTAPTGGISYPNGYVSALSVPVTITPATDAGSGVNTDLTVVQRAEADLLGNGTCGTFGLPATIELAGAADTDVVNGTCYLYQYVIWDNVDHVVTIAPVSIAKVNTEVLTGGSISYINGYVTTASIAVTVNEGDGAASSVVQRATATLSNGNCGTFGTFANVTLTAGNDTGASGSCYKYQLVVTDAFGKTATYTSANVVKVDTSAPTGGTISYTNGYVTTATIPITVGTASDPQSGVTNNVQRASSVLSNTTGNCAVMGSFIAVTLTGGADTTAVSGTCYQYRLVPVNGAGTAGTTVTSASVVKYDNAGPTGGSIDYTDGYDNASPIPVTIVTGTDAASGVSTSQVQRATATLTAGTPGTCGTFGSFANVTLTSGNDTGPATNTCYMYRLVVTDRAGLATTYTSAKVVKFDSTAPSLSSAATAGGILGKMETGNTLTMVFGESLSPPSVPSSVTVSESRSGSGSGTTTLSIPGVITAVTISNNYVTSNNTAVTATGTVVLSPDGKTITVTLGTVTGSAGTSSSNVTIAPASTLRDYAGNTAAGSDSLNQLF